MVETYLLRGKKNARSREMLCALTGLTDRVVRQEIEELRSEGIFICTDEDGNGYYISEDPMDVKRQYLKDLSRVCAISKRMKHERKFLKARGAL